MGQVIYRMPSGPDYAEAVRAAHISELLWELFSAL